MNVSDLAKELNTTDDFVLTVLKSLKLKAKGRTQELNTAVISVLKGEIAKKSDIPVRPAEIKKEKVSSQIGKPTEGKTEKKKATPSIKKPVKGKTTEKPSKETKVKDKIEKKKSAKITKPKEKISDEKKEKKKVRGREVSKQKVKISKEPVITLKPLVRKKRKPSPGSKEEGAIRGGKKKSTKHELPSSLSSTGTEISPDQVHQSQNLASAYGYTPVEEKPAAAVSRELADLEVDIPISVKDFSIKIQQKPSIVLKELLKMGIMAHINQGLDGEIVQKLAQQFGYNVIKTKTREEQLIETHLKEDDDPQLLKARGPVVTLMGHVDHGKTSLLDCIRKSNVTDREHGGITQHMGAYSVKVPKGRITVLDTPGHEAFTAMRARGAHITDLVVLVVAADEGVMPQTDEAIDHARAVGVPIIVALNKIDRKNADIDRVKKQLAQRNLNPEDWGGKTVVVGVSAITGEGVDDLLEMILLEAELLELKANAKKRASGIVVEAHLSGGKGVVTTLIVQSGTLKEGDIIIVGPYYGKVRAMIDDHKHSVKEAGPSIPVEILGLSDVPEAGENFYVVADEKQAKEISTRRQEQQKNKKLNAFQKITLEDLQTQMQAGTVKELNVVMKADVQGSLEALKDSLMKIPSDKIKIKFVHLGLGDVNVSDILLAVASKAIIIAFHVGIDPRGKEELEKTPVDVREYRIIYDAVNDIKNALEGMLEAKTKKKFLAKIDVRQVFKLSRGIVAGCYVQKGKVHRKAHIDVIRNDEIIHSDTLSSLKRFKDDVREVNEGMECGISLNNFKNYQPGDIFEAYEIETYAQKL